MLEDDFEALKKDHKFRLSCGETDLLIYLTQAMNQIQEQLKDLRLQKDKENQKPNANNKKESKES